MKKFIKNLTIALTVAVVMGSIAFAVVGSAPVAFLVGGFFGNYVANMI